MDEFIIDTSILTSFRTEGEESGEQISQSLTLLRNDEKASTIQSKGLPHG